MQFSSILFDKNYNFVPLSNELDFYKDLNLDQIIETTVSYRKEFEFKRYFYMPLVDTKSITYRQEVLKDLQNCGFYLKVDEFAKKMLEVQKLEKMIRSLEYVEFQSGWFLQMVSVYCEAVELFLEDLKSTQLHSDGFLLFLDFLKNYLKSDEYISLKSDMQRLKSELSEITYEINIDGTTFKVRKYEGEPDYTLEIEKIFQKFEQDEASTQECQYEKNRGMNHVNAKILEFVSRLYPPVFSSLEDFTQKYKNFIQKILLLFAHEVEFYISYLMYIEGIKSSSCHFCYPKIYTKEKSIDVVDGFDVSLAYALSVEKKSVVTNSYYLKGKERIIVISGANQGGKSTFARAVGQINYLAKLGLQVPAREAKLFLVDAVFTHFEKEEDIGTLHSKLQEDLQRVHDILQRASAKSLVILNEIFSSTSLQDAIFLSREIIKKIDKSDMFCVWVTFVEEVVRMSEKTVSMVSDIDHQNTEHRTYKIIRKEADGMAYAKSIAKKYRLSYEQILQRIEK